MESSLESIEPGQIQDFFKNICMAAKKGMERQEAEEDLDQHLKRINRSPKKWMLEKDLKELPKKVENVIKAEKESLGDSDASKVIEQLNDKIIFLETQLLKAKQEKEKAMFENKQEIDKLKSYLVTVRSRMEVFIKAKEERDRRLKELELKVKKTAKHRGP